MLKKFFSYYVPYKKLFAIDFICAVISAILELFFPIAVNMVIDQILPQGNLRHIVMFSVLLFALYLCLDFMPSRINFSLNFSESISMFNLFIKIS